MFLLLSGCTVYAQTITTITGNGIIGRTGDGGPAATAQVFFPYGITTDKAGNLYIADDYNYCIRKINTRGIITTIAGGAVTGYRGDNDMATAAEFSEITGVACDATGNIYVADHGNSRIRKISNTGIATTIAGNGSDALSGDGGRAVYACLGAGPNGIILDKEENIIFSDNSNIRKINKAGIITRLAGNGNPIYSGDGGPATAAGMVKPKGMALDAEGNLYVADYDDNRVRKITRAGIITPFAGNGYASDPGLGAYYGDGGPATAAELSGPADVAVDGAGNVYISDYNNLCVRKVNPSGIISTFAGTAVTGYSGDGGPATAAKFLSTAGLTIDAAGNLYICDPVNNRVRKVEKACVPIQGSIIKK